jgi:hypothetical protein
VPRQHNGLVLGCSQGDGVGYLRHYDGEEGPGGHLQCVGHCTGSHDGGLAHCPREGHDEVCVKLDSTRGNAADDRTWSDRQSCGLQPDRSVGLRPVLEGGFLLIRCGVGAYNNSPSIGYKQGSTVVEPSDRSGLQGSPSLALGLVRIIAKDLTRCPQPEGVPIPPL